MNPGKTIQTAYDAITLFYGDTTAKRSGVKYIDHIDQGLEIIDYCNGTSHAHDAYCLHPIIQSTKAFVYELSNQTIISNIECLDPYAVMLAVEYRSTANMYLSYKVNRLTSSERRTIKRRLEMIPDLKLCLIADKVQNFKDFLKYHQTHERACELNQYFRDWIFNILGVEDDICDVLLKLIDKTK